MLCLFTIACGIDSWGFYREKFMMEAQLGPMKGGQSVGCQGQNNDNVPCRPEN